MYRLVLTTALLLLVGSNSGVFAKEKLPFWTGYGICANWCLAHNKTENSQYTCKSNCWSYWHKNASDR